MTVQHQIGYIGSLQLHKVVQTAHLPIYQFESVGTMSRDQPSLYLAAGAAPRQTRFWYVGHRKIHAADTQLRRNRNATLARRVQCVTGLSSLVSENEMS